MIVHLTCTLAKLRSSPSSRSVTELKTRIATPLRRIPPVGGPSPANHAGRGLEQAEHYTATRIIRFGSGAARSDTKLPCLPPAHQSPGAVSQHSERHSGSMIVTAGSLRLPALLPKAQCLIWDHHHLPPTGPVPTSGACVLVIVVHPLWRGYLHPHIHHGGGGARTGSSCWGHIGVVRAAG